jgi:hypothetical protein
MPRAFATRRSSFAAPWLALLLLAPAFARAAADAPAAPHADSTWVDHDHEPIARPQNGEPNYWAQRFHQGFTKPVTHVFDIPDKLLWLARTVGARTRREAVNVNAFDEAPNSTWFTNRNHLRAVPVSELREGPDSSFTPRKPWVIKHAKAGGYTSGFQIKDADGKKWLVKLDSRGYAQLSSGADKVSRTLLHAAGYNVPHNEPVRFRRADLSIDPELMKGAKGEKFTQADLDSTLVQGAVFEDGSYSACASLFIAGHVLGSPDMARLRDGDTNDWYSHANRRELRGLFPVCAWIGNWDTEDHQFLDTFVDTRDSLGHVVHYILDAGSSLGAAATGPKQPWAGYENMFDLPWISRRIVTLGFVEEPWRRARQASGITSVGNYESAVYRPEDFRQLVPQPAFREMTDRDGYWGAKVVASFSDEQITAAVQSAHYDDPRADEYLVRNLEVRRDKIARYWFERVAPLDFFSVEHGALRFHDLAVDIGLVGARHYEALVVARGGPSGPAESFSLRGTEWPLTSRDSRETRLTLELAIAGSRAKPVRVELARRGGRWVVERVEHAQPRTRGSRLNLPPPAEPGLTFENPSSATAPGR